MDTPIPNDVRAEPTGSPVRFIRTLKEILMWGRTFEIIAELRLALIEFTQWYSTRWLVARDGYMTPA
ncbi:MAG: hypothetical protein V3R26_06650 [Hyphomicrobium sp.]